MKRPARLWLSLFTLLAFAVLVGLGVWQLQRLAWKEQLIARVEAARTGPVTPIERLLNAPGEVRDWARVRLRCERLVEGSFVRYGIVEGEVVWRLVSPCEVAGEVREVRLDRGLIEMSRGQVQEPAITPPPLTGVEIVGVLRRDIPRESEPEPYSDHPYWEYIVAVESETPSAAGLTPSPLPSGLSNRHLGYAVTWFGLAAALLGVYAAMLFNDRRRRPEPA